MDVTTPTEGAPETPADNPTPTPAPEEAAPETPATAPEDATAAVPAPEDATAAVPAPAALPTCPAALDMCSVDAGTTSSAFCPALSPFSTPTCMGGCCISSGKCTSSSCAISGIGKEVANTICYGLNPAIAIGASPNCRGLACKLAIAGCVEVFSKQFAEQVMVTL